MRTGVMELELGYDIGFCESPIGSVLVAHLPALYDVVRLVLLGGADQRCAVSERLGGIDDGWERLVVDHDRLAGILGDIRVVGDDACDLLSLKANLVGG